MFSYFFMFFLAFSGFPEEICCAELASPAVAPVAWSEILAMKELATSTQHISLGKPEKAEKTVKKQENTVKHKVFVFFYGFFGFLGSEKTVKKQKNLVF